MYLVIKSWEFLKLNFLIYFNKMMMKNCFVKGNIWVFCCIRKSECINCLLVIKMIVIIDRNIDLLVFLLLMLFKMLF